MKKLVIPLSLMGVVVAAALVVAADEEAEESPTPISTEHKVLPASEMEWADAPPGLPAGAKLAVLNGDPGEAGPFTVRLKAPAGYKVMPHTHPAAERVTVISGNLRVGMGEKFDEAALEKMGAGAYAILPARMAHFVTCVTETILQIDSDGPFQIDYVNPSDDPRKSKP
jgi:hypothetical protein